MTWLKAPEVNWLKSSWEERITHLINLLDTNPVLNQNLPNRVIHYLGNSTEVKELRRVILKSWWDKLKGFEKSACDRNLRPEIIHEAILRSISDEIIKQHVKQLLSDKTFEERERENFSPGRIHYPSQFYLVHFEYLSGEIIYFTQDRPEFLNSVYAEFYGELQDLKVRAKRTGEPVKNRRPVITIFDKDFPEIKIVPCSSRYGNPCVSIKVLSGFWKKSYAKLNFLYALTPAMTKDRRNQFNSIKTIEEKELKDIIKILNQRR